ncbi:MAG TPA: hypothetical protein VGC57_01285 [Cellulomonas sp.]
MSVLEDVLREVRTGARPGLAAARLGIDPGLAEAALDHWVRLGVVTPAEALNLGCSGCGTQPVEGAAPAPACAGCPTAPRIPRASAPGQRSRPVRLGLPSLRR